MKKTVEETAYIKEQKVLLGQAIKAIRTDDMRGYITLRKFAGVVGIPASNMKYIEDGVNAPSPEVYAAIISHLSLSADERKEMDALYSEIRGTPPPDICKIICTNRGMNEALRAISGQILTEEQLEAVKELLNSFSLVKEKR